MNQRELKAEYAKLNAAQQTALRKEFPGYYVTYLVYNEATDAITFNVKFTKDEYQWTAILPRNGKIKELRCVKQTIAPNFGYTAAR